MACPRCGSSSCGGATGNYYHRPSDNGLPSGYTSKPTENPSWPNHRFETQILNTSKGQYKTSSVFDKNGRVVESSRGKAGGFLTGIFDLFK